MRRPTPSIAASPVSGPHPCRTNRVRPVTPSSRRRELHRVPGPSTCVCRDTRLSLRLLPDSYRVPRGTPRRTPPGLKRKVPRYINTSSIAHVAYVDSRVWARRLATNIPVTNMHTPHTGCLTIGDLKQTDTACCLQAQHSARVFRRGTSRATRLCCIYGTYPASTCGENEGLLESIDTVNLRIA